MIDKIFLDTNVLVYLFDKSEKLKQSKVKRLISEHLQQSKIFISVQVINEFINITSNKIKYPVPAAKQKEIIELLNDLFLVSSLNINTSVNALDISIKYKLSFWDSLILSSAIENNCSILFTEDMQDGQYIEDKLKIINPFK